MMPLLRCLIESAHAISAVIIDLKRVESRVGLYLSFQQHAKSGLNGLENRWLLLWKMDYRML